MKIFFLVLISFVLGALIGVKVGYSFVEDVSLKAVEAALSGSYESSMGSISSLKNQFSGANARETVNQYNQRMQQYILQKKQEAKDKAQESINDYLKQKVDSFFN